jgi:predicted histone-like DNA-binding protein
MALKYKIVQQAEPGVKGGGEYLYYLRATGRRLITIDELAQKLAKETSLSEVSVKSVLWGLSSAIPDLLLNNYSVEVGELGIFSVSLKSDPVSKIEEATWRKIRNLKVNFRVGTKIQGKVKNAKFERVDT